MRKAILLLINVLIILSMNSTVFALEGVPYSIPKLMVEEYDTGSEYIIPGETKTLSVIIKNSSSKKAIKNVKLSFLEESEQILPKDIGTQFVKSIGKSGQYEWRLDIFAIKTAESRPYTAVIIMEYEDSNGVSVTMTDTVYLYVHQTVRLEYEKIDFPPRLTQADSVPFSVKLMNMGKGNILNALLTYDIPGLNNGSSVLVGTILPGETKTGTANFRVDKDVVGEVAGNLIISYEDEYGESYKKEIPLNTVIEEKVTVSSESEAPTQAEASKGENNLWIIYVAVGVIVALISVVFIVKYIKQRNQMKADEMRL